MHRKDFIVSSGILGGSALVNPALAYSRSAKKLRVGLIGVHGMGWSNLQSILKNSDIECTALCDVDEKLLDKRILSLNSSNFKKIEKYISYQDLLKSRNVDVVIIGTPDHWHCLQMVEALQHGKHVYIEKPIGNSIEECDIMVKAGQKSNLVVQVGQWQRSQKHFLDAIDFVHSGKLGKIRLVKAWSYVDWKQPIPTLPDSQTPEGVHYDLWLGPAEKRSFNQNRFHFEFRWFWDYAGGLMTDWGVHLLDYALMGMKVADPNSVIASGGKFAKPDGGSETPDTMTVVYGYEDFSIQWEHSIGIGLGPYDRNHGIAFIGNNGTLVLNRNGWEVIPEKDKMEVIDLQKPQENGLDAHMQNFVAAIRKNDKSLVNAPIEAGANIAKLSQLGNIAYRTGQRIIWDSKSGSFTTDEANKFIKAKYHNGYKLPTV